MKKLCNGYLNINDDIKSKEDFLKTANHFMLEDIIPHITNQGQIITELQNALNLFGGEIGDRIEPSHESDNTSRRYDMGGIEECREEEDLKYAIDEYIIIVDQ